jgi:DNA topoisomerase VI subunit B
MSVMSDNEMAKKKADVSVKIDPEVYRKAKMVTAHRNLQISEYLSKILDKPVSKDYEQVRKAMADEGGPPEE